MKKPMESLLDQEGLDEIGSLEMIEARFEKNTQLDIPALFTNASKVRVLTYSYSLSMIERILPYCEEVQVLFGRSDLAYKATDLFQLQKSVIDQLKNECLGTKLLENAILEKKLTLFLLNDAVSHEKMVLIESSDGNNVISGSANFSDLAYSGRQNESFILFRDIAAWKYFSEKYESIRRESADQIDESVFQKEEVTIEDLPVLKTLQSSDEGKKAVLIQEKVSDFTPLTNTFSIHLENNYRDLQALLPRQRGKVVLDRKSLREIIRYEKSRPGNEKQNAFHQLIFEKDKKIFYLAGRSFNLSPDPDRVKEDALLFIHFFRGFQNFKGENIQLAQDYFTFMSWLFFSPFICDHRNLAVQQDEEVRDYPNFGILYGQSNCGKTELIRFLCRSMFGFEAFLPKEFLTKSKSLSLYKEVGRFPLIFDDVDRARFDNHVNPMVKDDHFTMEEYPVVVLSMNAEKDTFESEVRKRALIFFTSASLPDDSQHTRTLQRSLKKYKRGISTHFYQQYLLNCLSGLSGEPQGEFDFLDFSSSILQNMLKPHSGTEDVWIKNMTLDQYRSSKNDKIKRELSELWRLNPKWWNRRGERIALKVEDPFHGRKLIRDIPDYLLMTGTNSTTLLFDKREIETFLDMKLSRGWFG